LAACEPDSKNVYVESHFQWSMLLLICVVGFPSIHDNEVQNLTASLLSEVYCDVGVEPTLQPLVVSLFSILLLTEGMVPFLMFLLGIFEVGRGSVVFLTLGCAIIYYMLLLSFTIAKVLSGS